MPSRLRLTLATAILILPTAGVSAPAGADCVEAGAYVTVLGDRTTVVPNGTCVAPTPFTTTFERSRTAGVTGVAEVGVSAGVPAP
jgi:hypothetical protein